MCDFMKTFECSCGKVHNALIDEYVVGSGVISALPDYVKKYGGTKAFIIADNNTFGVAGENVCGVLDKAGIDYARFIFQNEELKPNEETVGSAFLHFDKTCDMVIGVGSGVINDTAKIVASVAKVPYIIIATAPSMDGYASATSSMDVDGLKVSLPSRCANVVIGDIDILKNAPMRMLISGLGDMLAKYVSICEWRLSNVITGEYYCEKVAGIVKKALKKCVDNADGLLKRDENAVKAIFEGLVICGIAMNYAGLSRPASGVEHYFSHIWDMRGLEFGEKVDFHGIQCALGTLYASKIYELVKKTKPCKDRAEKYVREFDYTIYREKLRAFIGKGAESMILLEAKEGKYDLQKHGERLKVILEKWNEIIKIIDEEIPPADEIEKILDTINCPKSIEDIGIDKKILPMTFCATKDIRDKYVLSRLCFDLGILDEAMELILFP